jgi:NitT/TauT family transport system substrate-binding protein
MNARTGGVFALHATPAKGQANMNGITRWCGLAMLLALLGCSRKPQGGAGGELAVAPVKLALNWVPEPEFGGFYAARESGAYQRRGLALEIAGGGAGVPVLQMVATGRAQFGTVGGDELIIARARGADVVAVFATFQTSPQAIMVHQSRKLTSLKDAFKSGTVALEPGLPYAVFLKSQFAWEGAKIVPYDGGVARFLGDPSFAQQCYVTSEPLAAKRQGGDPQVFLIADAGYNPYATVVITSRELASTKPELVRAFAEASAEGWAAYLATPAPTNARIGALNPAMDATTLDAAALAQKPLIENDDTKAHGLGSMSASRWDTLAKQLAELKLIERAPAASEVMAPASH